MRPPVSGRRTVAIAIIAVLGVVVLVLSIVALTRTQAPTASDRPTNPVPTSTVSPTASASQTPTATPSPSPTAIAREDERFLAYSGATGWRATGGDCAGAAPVLQRLNDQGAWADVIPTQPAVGQIASLDAYSDGAAIVGGVDEVCAATFLRTFSAGAAWESYEGTLAQARYIDLADPGLVHTRSGEIAAPCAEARGLRAQDDMVALICDGQAWLQADASWSALELTQARAVAFDGDALIVGHESPECAGLAVVRFTGTQPTTIGCADGVDATQPIAIAPNDNGIAVWAEDSIVQVNQ